MVTRVNRDTTRALPAWAERASWAEALLAGLGLVVLFTLWNGAGYALTGHPEFWRLAWGGLAGFLPLVVPPASAFDRIQAEAALYILISAGGGYAACCALARGRRGAWGRPDDEGPTR